MKPIQLQGLAVCYDDRTIFEHVDALIAGGDRIAVIGANGCGKSSLLRVLEGTLAPSQGRVHRFGASVARLDSPSEDVGSWGEREWTALGALLHSPLDVLLLDEPTRHLDRGHRLELGGWIRRSRIPAIVVVSHDLDFLDAVASTTWHIEHGALREFSGTPGAYLGRLQTEQLAYQRQYAGQQLRIQRLQQDVLQTREQARYTERSTTNSTVRRKAKKVAKKAKAREHRIEQLIASEAYLEPPRDPHRLRFTWEHIPRRRGMVAKVEAGRLAYGDEILLDRLFLDIKAGDRIALVGDNGVGKSSLVEALLGLNLAAETTGYWHRLEGPVGWMAQVLPDPSDLTMWQYFSEKSSLVEGMGRAWLQAYGFVDEQLSESVRALSHGERVKLEIAALAASGAAVLVLDEPEHHLDWPSLSSIAQGLRHYPGTMLVISHVLSFLQEIGCEAVWQIADGQLNELSFEQLGHAAQIQD